MAAVTASLCFALLSAVVSVFGSAVEDVEDVYIFGWVLTGALLSGLGGYLLCWEIKKIWIAARHLQRMQIQLEGLCRAVQTLTQNLGP